MKKLLFIFLAINSIGCLAQTKVAEYHSDYFNQNFDILATLNKQGTAIDALFIYVAGINSTEKVALEFKSPYTLVLALKEIKDKYAEWIKIANDNGVTDMSKDIPVKLPLINVCWHSTKWWFSFDHRFYFRFMILDSGKKIISLNEKVKASSNEYIDQKFYWVFESVDELDNFIKKINIRAFESKLIRRSSNADLFQ